MPSKNQLFKQAKDMQARDWKSAYIPIVRTASPLLFIESVRFLDLDDEIGIDAWANSDNRQKDRLNIPGPEWVRLLENLFPAAGPYFKPAWDIFTQSPYFDYRHIFRRPGDPRVTTHNCIEWIHEFMGHYAGYNLSVEDLAVWAPYIMPYGTNPWPLLAAAIDQGGPIGEKVCRTLSDQAHETHALWSLLACSRPEAWETVGSLLLSAQREEGVRTAVLRAMEGSHPGAAAHLLRLIEEHDIVRFSSAARAINEWFGFNWDAISTGRFRTILKQCNTYLADPTASHKALKGKDAESVYIALCSTAFVDTAEAISLCDQLLVGDSADKRYVALKFLKQTNLPGIAPRIIAHFNDPSIPVAAAAVHSYPTRWCITELGKYEDPAPYHAKSIEPLDRLLSRLPAKGVSYKPPTEVWPDRYLYRSEVAALLVDIHTTDNEDELLRLLPILSPDYRAHLLSKLGGVSSYGWSSRRGELKNVSDTPLSPAVHAACIEYLADASEKVRKSAQMQLERWPTTPAEADRHIELLERTPADIRARAVMRLLAQQDDAVIRSIRILLADKKKPRRSAGLELAESMLRAGRASAEVRSTLRDAAAPRATNEKEFAELRTLADAPASIGYSLSNGLGLYDPSKRAPLPPLPPAEKPVISTAAMAFLASLDELINQNRTREIPLLNVPNIPGEIEDTTNTLGEMKFGYAAKPDRSLPEEQDRTRCPILDILEQAVSSLPEQHRTDPTLFIHACVAVDYLEDDSDEQVWRKYYCEDPTDSTPLRYWRALSYACKWLKRFHRVTTDHWYMNAALWEAHRQNYIHSDQDEDPPKDADLHTSFTSGYQLPKYNCFTPKSELPEDSVLESVYILKRHAEEFFTGIKECPYSDIETNPEFLQHGPEYVRAHWRSRAGLLYEDFEVLHAWKAGLANEQDVLAAIMQTGEISWHGNLSEHEPLENLLTPWKRTQLPNPPGLGQLLRKICDRILEIELARGDAPTAASGPAYSLAYSGGHETALRALAKLEGRPFVRGYNSRSGELPSVLTHLIAASRPQFDLDPAFSHSSTPQQFAALAAELGLSEEQLIQLALFAPQWLPFVAQTLRWPGFADAAWWIRAHTKTRAEYEDGKRIDRWGAAISQYTPISREEMADGAADAQWFRAAYKAIGPQRWELLYKAAKNASGGAGHKRAQLFADAILGNVTEKDLTGQIEKKRHQDAARALGLVPLPPASKPALRAKAVHRRYLVLHEFRRTSRKHGGSMLQASEKLAFEIGMTNLARNAGYPDPLRLHWAMELYDLGELESGTQSVTIKDTTLTLSVDDSGLPSLSAVRKAKGKPDRPLKSIPPEIKKHKLAAELTTRVGDLRKQYSRNRASLEAAMIRGDVFTGGELQSIFTHPVLRPIIGRLVFARLSEGSIAALGYPDKSGRALRSYDGTLDPLRSSDPVRLAHPADLLASGAWHHWQRECFSAERIQPFKQIFREYYTLTPAERARAADATQPAGFETLRYENHQVHARQTLALLGSREWVAKPEEGVFKTYHKEKITAYLTFHEYFEVPTEIEGLTVRSVGFFSTRQDKRLPLSEIPPRIFSEVMRDVDLVVSVAHRGGVDPESSQSTIEARAALLRETASLLNLTNISCTERHAIIRGDLGEYSLHLGSGGIQRLPGGSIWIAPVPSQHRGRIFLPFADEDPKTAEIISKALMLARDSQIRDPMILAQLRIRAAVD